MGNENYLLFGIITSYHIYSIEGVEMSDISLPWKMSESSNSFKINLSCSSISDDITSISNDEDKVPQAITDLEDGDSVHDIVKTIGEESLLSYNIPEKIIIILDRANDDNCTYFETSSGKKYSPLFMLHHALKIFLHNKAFINSQHEFALMQLNEHTATWVHDFTSSVQDILTSIRNITDLPCEPEDVFDLTKLFELISEKLDLNQLSFSTSIPPSYVVRTIFFYGRSYSLPELRQTTEVEKLFSSPYFTVDVIMTHEPPDSSNYCDQIFKSLQKIDMKGSSYTFSVSRNASELHCAMAKILSHPLQRPHQINANYDLKLLNI
ncbi:hypothetical protein FQA39_LY16675 [Lamprigera yunnana]|nr:hypothetical protein FQA39_LY16675 [Lamprigera yunnana]